MKICVRSRRRISRGRAAPITETPCIASASRFSSRRCFISHRFPILRESDLSLSLSLFRSLARSRGRYEFTRKSTIGPGVNSASPASASPFRKRESEREVSCNSLTKWDARARLRLRPPAQLTNPRQRDDEEEAEEEEEIRENGAPIVEIAPCIDVTVRIT